MTAQYQKPVHFNTKHGMRQTRIYNVWRNMRYRCSNPKYPSYKNYGGRGIKVTAIWQYNFENFYEWAMENGYSDELYIDRIDNDEWYTPENCRFVTMKENNRNKRNNKLTEEDAKEIKLLLKKDELSQTEIAKIYGVGNGTITEIKKGRQWF